MASAKLNYPLGYNANLFVYLFFLAICVFWMPKDSWVNLLRYKKVLIGSCLVFIIAFFVTAGGILIWYFETFDFEDETVFLNNKYRVVVTSEVITSGGRKYFAVLRRRGLGEYCVFKPDYYRSIDEPRVVEINEQPALILLSERRGFERDTLWFHDPR